MDSGDTGVYLSVLSMRPCKWINHKDCELVQVFPITVMCSVCVLQARWWCQRPARTATRLTWWAACRSTTTSTSNTSTFKHSNTRLRWSCHSSRFSWWRHSTSWRRSRWIRNRVISSVAVHVFMRVRVSDVYLFWICRVAVNYGRDYIVCNRFVC